MNSPINQASELNKRSLAAQAEFESYFARPSVDAAGKPAAGPASYPANGSACIGFLISVPLALVLWALPTAAWLLSGSVWLGGLAAALEFGVVAAAVWMTRTRRTDRQGRPL